MPVHKWAQKIKHIGQSHHEKIANSLKEGSEESNFEIIIPGSDLESRNFANEIKAKLVRLGYDNANLTQVISFGAQTEEIRVSYGPDSLPMIFILPLRAIPH